MLRLALLVCGLAFGCAAPNPPVQSATPPATPRPERVIAFEPSSMPFVLALTRFRFGMADRSVLDRNACYLPKVHEWIVLPDSERWQEVAAKRPDPIEPVTEASSRWNSGPAQIDWDFFGVNVSEVPGAEALRLESRNGNEAGLDRVADWFTRHCQGWVIASVRRDP